MGNVRFRTVLFRTPAEPDHQSIATPKLHIMAIDKALCLLNCFGVVGTEHRLKPDEMPVLADGVGSVFYHRAISRQACYANQLEAYVQE
jgi:hypothetical protein